MKKENRMEKVRLGEVCEIIAGQSPPSDSYNQNQDGLPFFQGKADFGQIYPKVRYWCTKPIKIALENDILFSLRAPVGPTNINNLKACIGRGLAAIRCRERVSMKFLLHYLRANENKIENLGTGSTFKAVTIGILKDIQIPLPPLDAQKHIATLLDTANSLRQKDKAVLQKYDALAQSLFLELFGDPACNPKNFRLRKLEDFYINKKDGTKCGPFGGALKKNEFRESGIAVWNMDNISKNGELNNEINLWISDEKYKELQSYSVINDDIIISRAGTVGKMCVVKTDHEKSIISTNLIRLRLDKNKLLPDFFTLLMTYFKERLGRLKTGSEGGFTHMNTGVLNDLIFPYPPIELQNQFAEQIQLIEKQKALVQENLAKSEALFMGLLAESFG